MINKITLKNVATFNNETITPNKINFVFGSNGTGKTTISRVLNNISKYPDCSYDFENNHLELLVFNKDFIDANIDAEKMNGVFMLGDGSKRIKTAIEKLNKYSEKIQEDLEKKEKFLTQKINEIIQKNDNIKDSCWSLKTKHATAFAESLKGYVGSKERFFEAILKCHSTYDAVEADALTLTSLKQRYEALFGETKYTIKEFNLIDLLEINRVATSPLLEVSIVGASSSSFGEYIKNMNLSDWVKGGLKYLKEDKNEICPFCQQNVSREIYAELINFFDEKYQQDCTTIIGFSNNYKIFFDTLTTYYSERLQEEHKTVSFESLNTLFRVIHTTLAKNIALLHEKINTPSKIIKLYDLNNTFKKFEEELKKVNTEIVRHNKALENFEKSKNVLQSDIFKYFLHDKIIEINNHLRDKNSLEKARTGVSEKILKLKDFNEKVLTAIKRQSAKITNVTHVIHSMNDILKSYGFDDFELSKHDDNSYKIMRKNGNYVKNTLSEGEKNFITFLYFYHLIKGSLTEEFSPNGKIIVIDDPVSSLDSNTLFIVTSLIKEIVTSCKEKSDIFKQVFILTHNTFFYNEVSHYTGSENNCTTFFTIRKKDSRSLIEASATKPIRTYYELLWDEVRDPTLSSRVSIFNAMRRIIEHYFSLTGQIKVNEIISKFEPKERLICQSLIASQHSGSHVIPDDFMLSPSPEHVEHCKEIFRKIFYHMGHIAHHEMMMSRAHDLVKD